MAILKLTDANVLSFRPTATDTWLWDTLQPGFAARIRKGAKGDIKRTWVIAWEFGGKSQKMKLGEVGGLPCKDAREEAARHLSRARLGDNPLTAKRAEAERLRRQVTFGESIEPFLEFQEKVKGNRPGSLREQRRHLQKDARELHRLGLDEISKEKVKHLLDRLHQEIGVATSMAVRASLSAMFVWAMEEGKAAANPTVGIRRLEAAPARERTLEDPDIMEVWSATEDDTPFNRIVRMLLLNGLRRCEVSNADWSEFDLGKALWTIPAARMKAGKTHVVPLSPQALRQLPERPAKGGPVFDQFSGFSNWKIDLDRRIAAARRKASIDKGFEHWTIHDLRRSVASGMAALGVSPWVVEEVLSHTSYKSGVMGVYQRHDFLKEKRAALELWGNHIEAITSGGNVVPMKRTA